MGFFFSGGCAVSVAAADELVSGGGVLGASSGGGGASGGAASGFVSAGGVSKGLGSTDWAGGFGAGFGVAVATLGGGLRVSAGGVFSGGGVFSAAACAPRGGSGVVGGMFCSLDSCAITLRSSSILALTSSRMGDFGAACRYER